LGIGALKTTGCLGHSRLFVKAEDDLFEIMHPVFDCPFIIFNRLFICPFFTVDLPEGSIA
jgi:hypothetical protein